MKLSLPKLLTSFIVCSTLLSLAPSVLAQDISLVVSPPQFDLTANPGEIIQKTIKITNNNTESLTLQAFPVDFIVTDDLGTPVKVAESASGRYLASPWFTLDQTEFSIAPKETIQIVAIIAVPNNALPGGHYAGVYFEPKVTRSEKKTISYTNAQLGSLFSLTIAGDLKYDALIKEFKTKSFFSEFGPIEFSTILENQSDTHIRPLGKIEISNMIGQRLETLALDQINIFPFASRSLTTSWKKIWGLGRYSATLSFAYGPGLETSRTIYFWILPYRLIAAILVIILVFLALFIIIRRHLKHREDTRDSEIEELKHKIAEMENQHH